MPPRKELCRNFQRGSCQYGDRCKFLHAAPQQSAPNGPNPFGFGVDTTKTYQRSNQQMPQQQPNPFGFGFQKNTQSSGGADFGSRTTQFKPFENKWTRSSPLGNNITSASRENSNQPQPADHKCTDPELCKRIIVQDLENQRPLWKLTCYGHNGYGACDITGDTSFEELRALAYDGAKSGRSLQSIIETERSLVNSKVAEFQSLSQKPYTVSPFAIQNTSAGMGSMFPSINSGASNPASGFSQFGQSLNSGTGPVPTYSFNQPSHFQNNQPSSNSVMSSSPFSRSGPFGSHLPQAPVQSTAPFGSTHSSNGAAATLGNAFAAFSSNVPNPVMGATEQPSISIQLNNVTSGLENNVDDGIWTKSEWKWNAGEIPEEPPPDIRIH